MKGIPESFDKELFDITIKPIYIDKGRLVLDLKYPVNQQLETIEKPYTIFIDEIPTNLNDSNTILDTGIHHISIVSDFYRNETRIFTIEQAQSTLLEIQLRDIAPTLQFLIPAGTQIFLDDNLIENGEIPFIVSQGEHIIRCVIGDYEVIKSIQVINGRSYIVNLKFEMDILENQ